MTKILPATYTIEFSACTGFGDVGRSASIYTEDRECLGTGYGETDGEAVLEAIHHMGYSFDQSFDMYTDVQRKASRVCYYGCSAN